MKVRGLLFPETAAKWRWGWPPSPGQASFCLHFSSMFLPPFSLEKRMNIGRKNGGLKK